MLPRHIKLEITKSLECGRWGGGGCMINEKIWGDNCYIEEGLIHNWEWVGERRRGDLIDH